MRVLFAAGYGCGAYGQGADYNACATEGIANQPGGSFLQHTGDGLYIGIGGGALLIVLGAAVFMRSWRRHRRSQ